MCSALTAFATCMLETLKLLGLPGDSTRAWRTTRCCSCLKLFLKGYRLPLACTQGVRLGAFFRLPVFRPTAFSRPSFWTKRHSRSQSSCRAKKRAACAAKKHMQFSRAMHLKELSRLPPGPPPDRIVFGSALGLLVRLGASFRLPVCRPTAFSMPSFWTKRPSRSQSSCRAKKARCLCYYEQKSPNEGRV